MNNRLKKTICNRKERREMAVGDIKAEMVQVIRVIRIVGTGTEKDPVRTEVQYWEQNGKLIVKKDQSEDVKFMASL
jgi:hypothetical protein